MKFITRFTIAMAAIVAILCVGSNDAGTYFGIATSLAFMVAPMLRDLGSLRGYEGFAADAVSEMLEGMASNLADAVGKFKTTTDELRTKNTDYLSRLERGESVTAEIKRNLDEVLGKANEQGLTVKGLEEKLREIAEQVKSRESNTPAAQKSVGEQVAESEKFKAFQAAGYQGGARIEVKQVNTTAAGGLMRQPYRDGLVSLERQRLTIRDLLTVIPVQSSSVEYAKQSVRTNAAAPVAEAATKPYSDYAWTLATANIRVLAHLAKITRQAADDAPRLVAEVESEMRYGLNLVEEAQLLNGSGTGQNILGINPQATAFNQAAALALVDNPTMIDVLRLALLQNVLAGAPADGIVLNPIDWALIELTKTTDGAYLFANPQSLAAQNMWRVPVVDTVSQTQGDFLVGAFKYGAHLYDRMAVEVLLSSENADDFEKNLMTMRCEERIGLGVLRTYAFTKGDFQELITAANA